MLPRRVKAAAWVLTILLGIAFGCALLRAERVNAAVEAAAKAADCREIQAAAGRVDGRLQHLEAVVHGLVAELESGRLKLAGVPERLRAVQEPGEGTEWQLAVLAQPGLAEVLTGWGDRHAAPEGKRLLVDYAEPFRLPGAQAASGVVRLELALEYLRDLVNHSWQGSSGYAFLLSPTGAYLADPKVERVLSGRTILQLAEEEQDPGRRCIGQKALLGERGFAEGQSSLTGQRAWMFVEPIPRAHWALGTVMIRDEQSLLDPGTPGRVVGVVSLGLGFGLGLVFLLFCSGGLTLARWWRLSLAGSLVLLVGTGVLWYYAYVLPQRDTDPDVQIHDEQELRAFQRKYSLLELGLSRVKAQAIPTGIYVDVLEFVGPGQVRVAGRLWQRFARDASLEARAGLTFPEAVAGEIKKDSEKPEGDGLIQFYTFNAVLKQKFANNINYPFDQARVRIWIRPRAMGARQTLAPDLASYLLLTPTSLPGLDHELDVAGWMLGRSYFSILLQSYNAKFGLQEYAGQQDFPELLFNVTLSRKFVNPFIATFLPILAVVGLLFALVLTISRHPENMKATSYSFTNFIRAAITLLFPLILAQINLRNKILTDHLIYVEYCYFVVYAQILLVTASALAFAHTDKGFMAYGDNAISKLTFWPFLLGSFYLVSILFLL